MTDAYSQPLSRTRPPRILIVEDDLVIALMIEEFVREFGYAVSSVAGTVAMARQQIALRNFDAVLLDINMEGEYQPETADIYSCGSRGTSNADCRSVIPARPAR